MAENSHTLRISSFHVDEDNIANAERWDEWIDEVELNFRVSKITEPSQKKDILLLYGGKEVRKLDKSLASTISTEDEYLLLKTKLTDYFSPKKNKFYNRYVFLNLRPHHRESTASYVARLREKTTGCDFHNDDERILEQLMITSVSQELIRKVIYKKLDLQKTLEAMQLIEDTTLQVQAMSKPDNIAKVKRKSKPSKEQMIYDYRRYERCKYCDRHHPKQKEQCPAWGKTCNKCGKQNHFANVCTAVNQNRQQSRGQRRDFRRDIRRTSDDPETVDSEDDYQGSEFIEQSINHMRIGKIKLHFNKITEYEKTVPIVINDVIVRMEPDSGADANVMDEYQYKTLRRKIEGNIDLKRCNTKLSTLQNYLPVSGVFNAILRNTTRGTETSIIVVKGKINSPPLLGKKTLSELVMLEIRPDGSLKAENDLGIRKILQ